MDGIVSAEHFNVLYKQPQFYSSSTGTTLKGHGWILASSPGSLKTSESLETRLGWIHGTHVSWSSFYQVSKCQSVHESSPESRFYTDPCTPGFRYPGLACLTSSCLQ